MTITGQLNIPTSVEQLDAEWLTAALREGGGSGEVTVAALDVEPVGVGLGIMSVLFRVRPTYASGTGPASLVVKMAPPYEQVRQVAAGYGFYEREVEIYRMLGGQVGLRPPRLFHAAHDAETDDFVVVMEDFGHLRTSDQLIGCSLGDAKLVIGELARHHARWWADPRLDTLPFLHSWAEPPFPQFNLRAGEQSWPVILERFGHLIPDRIRALGERWAEIGPPLMEDGPNHPATLCHGDVRLDNIFFHDDVVDPVSIVDWQIAGIGPGANDVAYFLSQSLTVDDRRAHGEELTRLYHETLVDHGVTDYPFEEFHDDYRSAVLFCLCYPMQGGAVELVNDRAVALASSMLERSMSAIIDLDADELAPT